MNTSLKALAGLAALAAAVGTGLSIAVAAPPIQDNSAYNKQNVAPGVSGSLPAGASTNAPAPGVSNSLPPGVTNHQF